MCSAPTKCGAQCYALSLQIFTNICEVTVQEKRAIGEATLHKLPIYNEYSACVESPHYSA